MKFKIGDLVTLSSAGRERKQNESTKRGFGMITSIDRHGVWPYGCAWYGGSASSSRFKEYELKRYRGAK